MGALRATMYPKDTFTHEIIKVHVSSVLAFRSAAQPQRHDPRDRLGGPALGLARAVLRFCRDFPQKSDPRKVAAQRSGRRRSRPSGSGF
eukprot:392021-Prymnesium_polylepis.1